MDRKVSGLAALLTGALAAACGGGGTKYGDATVSFDGGSQTDGPAPDTAGPGPMMGAGSRLVIPGDAFLVGVGTNSCTNQVPATGDRWCAFAMPSTFPNQVDLFVVNATQAAAGTAISCAGTDPNCLRLTTDLFVDLDEDIRIHGFDGDTLIYYAETGLTAVLGGPFVGPVYAWRPGWPGGRKLTSDTGVLCVGHPTAEAAICFDNRDTTTVTTNLTYDLHAGALPAAATAPPLAKLETVLVQTSSDPQGVSKFEFDFSPDGNYVAWSARPTATGVETLKVQRLGEAAPTTVASDVTQWLIAPDGMRWYWLKAFNYSTTGMPSGTLESAVFPGGGSPVPLATNVGEFSAAGNTGVVFRDAVTVDPTATFTIGNLKLIANRDTPTAVTLDSAVIGVVDVSLDGSRVVYAKTPDASFTTFDMYVGSVAGLPGRCVLTSTPTAAPFGAFLSSASGIVWARFNNTTGDIDGMFTSVATCASAKFSTNILNWLAIADQGYIFGDDSLTGADMTLRYTKPTGTTLPVGTSVHTLATPIFAPLLPALPAVVYTVNQNVASDGLYINAMLPFTPG